MKKSLPYIFAIILILILNCKTPSSRSEPLDLGAFPIPESEYILQYDNSEGSVLLVSTADSTDCPFILCVLADQVGNEYFPIRIHPDDYTALQSIAKTEWNPYYVLIK